MINERRLLDTFIELLKISSPSFKEHKVIEYVKNILEENEFYVELQEYEYDGKRGINLLAIKEGNGGTKNVLLEAHADTVEPCENVNPVIEGDVIKSDGTTILGADDKSGIASILELARILKSNKTLKHGNIVVVITSAEEQGLIGMQNFDFSRIKVKVDYGYVLDASGNVGIAILASPHYGKYKIEVKGKSAHAGIEPEKGINAIKIASEIVTKLPQGRIDEETTTNVGIIKGGIATNIVPESCIVEGEARSITEQKMWNILNSIEKITKGFTLPEGASLNIETKKVFSGYRIPEDSEVVKNFVSSCERIGIKPVFKTSTGASDANILVEKGIETLDISTGMMNPHTKNEYIHKKDLIKLTELIILLVTD